MAIDVSNSPDLPPPATKAPPNCEASFSLPIIAAMGMALACCVLFHGYEIFNSTLSIDEEERAYLYSPLTDIRPGRWGAAVYSWLVASSTTDPVTSIAVGLALYSASFVVLVRILKIQNWQSIVIAAPIFFGFPVLLYAIAFNYLALHIGLGSIAAEFLCFKSPKNGRQAVLSQLRC